MIFLNIESKSILPKTIFSFSVLLCTINIFLKYAENRTNLNLHNIIFIALLVVYVIRLEVTVWVFQKRKWTYIEAFIISCVMPLALYCFHIWNFSVIYNNNVLDVIAVFFFSVGSFLNTDSELTRYRWKKINKGHLYTGGLFKYSMHINYFGDILLFIGIALYTNRVFALIIPFLMALNFIFFVIPSLDNYLEIKYASEYQKYKDNTKILIPFIY